MDAAEIVEHEVARGDAASCECRQVRNVPFGSSFNSPREDHELTGSYSRLAGLLLDYASRVLVLAQPDKLRMS